MPFSTDETATCNSLPMRPPIRKLSNNFSEDDDTEVYSDDEEIEPLEPVRKNSLCSNISNHTRLTASETESEEEYGSRHIRFCMIVKKYLVESHRSYSKQERSRCWYSSEEKKKRNDEVAKVVARMDRRKPEKRGRPYRGLTCWTKEGTAELNLQINRTMNAVLDEQDRQWDANVTSEGRIASICREMTGRAVELALATAYQDELEAAAIQGSPFGCTVVDDDSTVGGSVSSFSSKKRRAGRKDAKRGRARRKGRRRDLEASSSEEFGKAISKAPTVSRKSSYSSANDTSATESCGESDSNKCNSPTKSPTTKRRHSESIKASSPKTSSPKSFSSSRRHSDSSKITPKAPSSSPKSSSSSKSNKEPSVRRTKSSSVTDSSRKVHRDPPGKSVSTSTKIRT